MKRTIDPVGKKYGKLLVLEEIRVETSSIKNRKSILKLKCQCDCGNIILPFKSNVLYGKTTQCSYCQNSDVKMGEKRGSLTIISRVLGEKKTKFLCICECGFQDEYTSRFLLHGKKIACQKCRFFKKFGPKIEKKTRKQALTAINFQKHLRAKQSIIGRKNGRLKVIDFSHWEHDGKRRRSYYKAKCKCGNEIVRKNILEIRSCGCLQKDSVPKAENKHNAKLTNSQVLAIKEMKKSNLGYTGRQFAKMFKVNEQIISKILKGNLYKSVK